MSSDLLKILETNEKRFAEITELLADPRTIADKNRYRELTKEHSSLAEIIEVGKQFRYLFSQVEENREIVSSSNDQELVELAQTETAELEERLKAVQSRLELLLIPRDPGDEKNAIVEIRAGTGGEEAALFAANLFRMYAKFIENKGWKIDIMNTHDTGIGGLKEVIFMVEGKGAYGELKMESGVHRVQRVPQTEASGRIHTSAASVAVLPEAEEVDIQIDPNDLKVDVYRSSGPGGQSVNTTDSAVRITHIPTGTVVTCQDEKSQLKNKNKALKVLRARLLDRAIMEQQASIARQRKTQVGTGDRSEKIRTYNFPQNRVTDHRFGLTLYNLEDILNGDLDQLIEEAKKAAYQLQLEEKAK
ncbi:MAG: peptide chain release factor 1 [candidate division Zixibacteria bacterium RBG_16_53_22]|nr:MAG: peptide chain release factor 1 [candidate division Zixibacteria bacterium RBG_16_53_22]